MKTTEPLETDAPVSPQQEEDDRSSRRLLVLLLWLLGIVAIALLALLIWLLWPEGKTPSGQAAGYPIEVVTTIYGFGENPNELLQTPLGVAFDNSGHVWISNTGQSRVEEYTTSGEFVRMLGAEDGPGKLGAPYGLTVDPATDRVYVADYGIGLLQIYTTSGEYVGHFPADDEKVTRFGDGFSPYAVHVVDGRVVVSSNDGLYFFDTEGHVVSQWVDKQGGENVRGRQFGQFNFPDSFTVDPETGTFYIADTMNRRVVAIGSDGKWLWTSGTPDSAGEISGFWQLPRSIQLGPDGNLYVIDTFRPDGEGMGAGHIVVLSRDGELLSEFGRTGLQDGAFAYPDQLTFDGGELWAIADRENHRVVIFRLHTPYPDPSQIEADKYQGMISNPFDTWSTPKSERSPAPSA
jgi:DNA-binding beta-propeller fold protein YncE